MEITFADNKLCKLANDDRKMTAQLGIRRAGIFRRRLSQLQDAATLEEVRFLPGNYHELTGDRKGQWACDLDQPYRLVIEPQLHPIPIDGDGKYLWNRIHGIIIIEIADYH